jgi:very-short-patch-repair endonuclease
MNLQSDPRSMFYGASPEIFSRAKEQREIDENRTFELEQLGLKVIRFTNDEVFKNIENVIKKIEDYLKTPLNPLKGT